MKSRFALGPFLLGSLLVIASWRAEAQTFTTLYSFTPTSPNYPWTNSDGAGPRGGLILSGSTLYGATSSGGSSGSGVVFKMSIDGTEFTNLHNFKAITSDNVLNYPINSDGVGPWGGLILSGNTLYGGAALGGSSGNGTIFKINTDGSGFTNLHIFKAGGYSSLGVYTNSDGDGLSGDLISSDNTLYGTAQQGGSAGSGTVFKMNMDGSGFTNLYSFAANLAPDYTNSDGAGPNGSLVLSGNILYGTAQSGGSSGNGTVFAVNTDGTGFTNLHSFTQRSPPFSTIYTNADGGFPRGGLVLSGSTLYGTAFGGGSSASGTVFAINTDGSDFTTLYSLMAIDLTHNTNSDGFGPNGGLVLLGNTLYGTTQAGGSSNGGVVFAVNKDGTGFTNLHDGGYPSADLLFSGNTLYGAAGESIFSLSLPAINPPQMTITHSAANVILSWPTDATGFVLQSATTLANGGDWQD
jgi:uncharacterized repeat protein (TIGR03803 family)